MVMGVPGKILNGCPERSERDSGRNGAYSLRELITPITGHKLTSQKQSHSFLWTRRSSTVKLQKIPKRTTPDQFFEGRD